MKNLQHSMKLAHDILNKIPTLAYKKNQFHFSCGKNTFKSYTLQEIEDYIMQLLYNHWLDSQFEAKKTEPIVIESVVSAMGIPIHKKEKKSSKKSHNEVNFETRQTWSKGKTGDPRRKKPNSNRKTKRFTKTEVLGWIRQRVNGRFSSEKITHSQYCEEFLHENKNAEQRRHWREKNGKKSSYSNKIVSVR